MARDRMQLQKLQNSSFSSFSPRSIFESLHGEAATAQTRPEEVRRRPHDGSVCQVISKFNLRIQSNPGDVLHPRVHRERDQPEQKGVQEADGARGQDRAADALGSYLAGLWVPRIDLRCYEEQRGRQNSQCGANGFMHIEFLSGYFL